MKKLRLLVYYDGSCAVCQASRSWVERRDGEHRIDFVDFHTLDDDHLPAPRQLLESNIVAERGQNSGELTTGYDAWCDILALLPRWRGPARIFKWAGTASIGREVYRFIATHRLRIGGHYKGKGGIDHEIHS